LSETLLFLRRIWRDITIAENLNTDHPKTGEAIKLLKKTYVGNIRDENNPYNTSRNTKHNKSP
jgi:hypothetical protein